MTIAITDYLIDLKGIDWGEILKSWAWLLPAEFDLWMVSRMADLFIVLPDKTVHMLDVGRGSLDRVADSREDFRAKINADNNANYWLAIPLVDDLVAAGITLPPGYCYGFAKPPILGADYTVANCRPLPIGDYLGAYGSIHEQLLNAPDGTPVVLKVINSNAVLKTDSKQVDT